MKAPTRWILGPLVLGILLAAAAMLLPGNAGAATTFSNPNPITLVDESSGQPVPANPYPSEITVSGLSGSVTDVDVRLNGVTHTFLDDIDALLVSPTGSKLLFLSDACGDPDLSNVTFTFDDSAATGLSSTGTPACTTGSWKPTDSDGPTETNEDAAFDQTVPADPALNSPYPEPATAGTATLASQFNGTSPNGVWKLYIVDDAAGDSGMIAGGWDLIITAGGPTAVSVTSFTAQARQGDVALSWRTASEAGVAGYNVWRVYPGGHTKRLNASLIAARSRAGAEAAYRFVDRKACNASAAVYRLQAVNLDGSKRWLGTARVLRT